MNLAKHCVLLNKLDARILPNGYFRRFLSESSSSNAAAESNPSSSTSEEVIEIPKRVERSHTDILKALASTVGTDYTAPLYRYHDDPWLIPYTQIDKREFWLAKESGRKAARFIAERHPHLFNKNRIYADPPITAFQPRSELNRDNVTPELLDNYITNLQVEDAITVYDLLKEKKKNLPKEMQQDLLELLAYNAEEEELTAENRITKGMIVSKKEWASGGLAERLYSKLKSPEARLTMLLGLAKYNQPERAKQMWDEMKANEDIVPLEGYNAIISVVTHADFAKLKDEVCGHLEKMRSAGHLPNEETLVSCLATVARFAGKLRNGSGECKEFALALLSEFKSVGVEPCLGAYLHLLDIYYSKRSRDKSMILQDILNEVGSRADSLWPAKTPADLKFIPRAMEVAQYLNQVKLAYRIHELLHTGNNLNLLATDQDSLKYHHDFFVIILRNESLDVSMALFNKLFPHLWTPGADVFEQMLMAINSSSGVNYLGKLYDDMEISEWGKTIKEKVYEINKTVLRIIDKHPSSQSEFQNLGPTYADIAYRIFTHLKVHKNNKMMRLKFNVLAEEICSLALKILLIEDEFSRACEVFEFCNEEKEFIPGRLSDAILVLFMNTTVQNGNIELGMQIVEYMVSFNSSAALQCAQQLATLNLSQHDKQILNKNFAQDQKWALL
eukprot:TRINITY_DN6395_c0_g1_i4.p1 TRINITY_DN6395_c0_g1~~TRINITY_DN6395_c0_g1_i4.p1  ORF type:complete len:673 (-),score=144.76 TRINITY_DN6395_c0_g1_i4:54-2072(-)